MRSLLPAAAILLVASSVPAADGKTGGPAPTAAPAPVTPPEAAAPEAGSAERRTALTASLVLKVVSPTETRRRLVDEARRLGGFPVLISDDALVLKVPPAALSSGLAAVAAEGLVLDKTLTRADLTQEIAELEGRLRSKREVLARLRGFFDDSDAEATLRIEQTMTGLVAEIEQIRGSLRVAEERARHAVVEISFRYQRRDAVVYVESPFEWLNTVDLGRLIEEFH